MDEALTIPFYKAFDAKKIVFDTKTIVFDTKTIVFDTKTIDFDTKTIDFDTKTIVFDAKRIISLFEIKIFRTKLLFSEAKSTFYASETGFSIAEKTAGEAPAVLCSKTTKQQIIST